MIARRASHAVRRVGGVLKVLVAGRKKRIAAHRRVCSDQALEPASELRSERPQLGSGRVARRWWRSVSDRREGVRHHRRSPNIATPGQFLSGALDFADSVRFSKFECFERVMNSNEAGFCGSSRTGNSNRFRIRHMEVRIPPPQPGSARFREFPSLDGPNAGFSHRQ